MPAPDILAMSEGGAVTIAAAIIGAIGTVISAWVAGAVRRVHRRVNGNVAELELRVRLLEQLVQWSSDDWTTRTRDRGEKSSSQEPFSGPESSGRG